MIGRSAPALGPVITDKAIAQCLFGRALDRWIDRRADPQAARVNAIGAGFGGLPEFSDQFAPDIFDKPAAHAVGLGLIGPGRAERSEERRVGNECVSTCRSRLSTCP